MDGRFEFERLPVPTHGALPKRFPAFVGHLDVVFASDDDVKGRLVPLDLDGAHGPVALPRCGGLTIPPRVAEVQALVPVGKHRPI